MAPVPAFAAGNGKRASAASKDAGPSCRTSLRSARVASSARFGADGTRAPMVRVTHLLEPCGRPSWLLSGASTALCLPRSGQLGRVFTSGRGSVRTGSIPHSIPSLLHRAEHEEKPAGAYADKRGRSIFQTRRRLRAQMILRGALNTRREDGGSCASACCAAGKRDLPRISRSGVRSGRADSPERQTSEFQLQRQRHRGLSP